mmetsp:Transcript_17274/g.41602  ORF Transcript_17274/g.41602 Transcript_17274/m.41602 type:complete len:102 (+) Transcript_17274:220-525(+)
MLAAHRPVKLATPPVSLDPATAGEGDGAIVVVVTDAMVATCGVAMAAVTPTATEENKSAGAPGGAGMCFICAEISVPRVDESAATMASDAEAAVKVAVVDT